MAFVKSVSVENNTGTAQTTLVFPSTSYANGNTLTVEVGWETANVISTITDAASQSWNAETREVHSGVAGGLSAQAFHIGNTTGLSGTVTLTFAGTGCTWAHAVLKEYSGMPLVSNNKDQYITAEGQQTAGPTTPPASGNVTTTQGDEVCTSIVKAAAGQTFSAQTINSVGGSNIITFSDTCAFNTFPTNIFTGQAEASMNVNAYWVMTLLTLKANVTAGVTPAVVSKHSGRSIGIGIGKGIFN